MKQFKDFVGYKDLPLNIHRTSDLDYATLRRVNQNYRALPATYAKKKCSGRGPLHNSGLVAHDPGIFADRIAQY